MKCLVKLICAFLFLLPVLANAGWQVANPSSSNSNEPSFQAGPEQGSAFLATGSRGFPREFANLGRPAAVYAISVSGSLKENVERIMDRYHWKVIWKATYDYNFDGRITGTSLPDVIQKLLNPFPLQAVLYMSNRTMIVIPRKV